MKTIWIIGLILFIGIALGVNAGDDHHADAPPPGPGLLSRLFGGLLVPEYPGEKTETILPTVVKDHHEHVWIKKPHFQEEVAESFGKKQKQIIHKHVKHQKVIHENHLHKHILNEHTQHKVHTHNLHNYIHHIHEHTKEQQHIHKPVYHQYEHHQHKVTHENRVKETEAHKDVHQHSEVVTKTQAPPIHQKEWSILGWLQAWRPW